MERSDIFDTETMEFEPEPAAIVVRQRPVIEMTKERIDLIKRTIAKNASDDELELFIEICKRTQLDPFSRQIYAIKRWDSTMGREVMAAQCSIDGFRVVAERSGEYQGQTPAAWCGPDGEWREVWLASEPPAAAKVGVYRQGFKEPIYGIARFDAYAQRKKDGSLTLMWNKMADVMIAKCAEALALRKAFPQDLSGLYTTDEMEQATPAKETVKVKEVKEPDPVTEPLLDPDAKWKDWSSKALAKDRKGFIALLGRHGFEKPDEVKDRKAQVAIFKEWNAMEGGTE